MYDRIECSTTQRQCSITDKLARAHRDVVSPEDDLHTSPPRNHALRSQARSRGVQEGSPYRSTASVHWIHAARDGFAMCAWHLRELRTESSLSMVDFDPHWHKDHVGLDFDIYGVLPPFRVEKTHSRPSNSTKPAHQRNPSATCLLSRLQRRITKRHNDDVEAAVSRVTPSAPVQHQRRILSHNNDLFISVSSKQSCSCSHRILDFSALSEICSGLA